MPLWIHESASHWIVGQAPIDGNSWVTNPFQRMLMLAITVHYADSEFKLHEELLDFFHIPASYWQKPRCSYSQDSSSIRYTHQIVLYYYRQRVEQWENDESTEKTSS